MTRGLIAMLVFVAVKVSGQEVYTDTKYEISVPFGTHDHWIEPWRAYLETQPAGVFLNGVGVALTSPNADLTCEMLRKHYIKCTRIEVGWGSVRQDGTITNQSTVNALIACKKWQLRPILLLNSNEGVPCPLQGFTSTVASNASQGDKTLSLTSTSGFVIGKTGISSLTRYRAAEILVTGISGNTVTLSKPLPFAISAGTKLQMCTLVYRPWSRPGSADYAETMAGWQKYVLAVAALANQYVPGQYDLEIWNELTFGSAFLDINNYYSPTYWPNPSTGLIWSAIVQATADVITANPSLFKGVEVSDGFANTIPWPASSTEPSRVIAISKHPYPRSLSFPKNEQGGILGGQGLNALLSRDPKGSFIPAYSAFFPEYAGTNIQTECLLHDCGPFNFFIQGVWHGRYTRPDNPCSVWITECGMSPSSAGITDQAQALLLKAKTSLRFFCFFLNKGCSKVTLYASSGGNLGLGIVQDNFLSYCVSTTVYPQDDKPFTSPALAAIANIAWQMRLQFAPVSSTRHLAVLNVLTPGSFWKGDGSLAHPDLFASQEFVFLPFQSNQNRFVIPFYLMTRSLVPALQDQPVSFTVSGFNQIAGFQCLDPISNRLLPVSSFPNPDGSFTLSCTVSDYPRLLIVTD
jgi:hypothetical protein